MENLTEAATVVLEALNIHPITLEPSDSIDACAGYVISAITPDGDVVVCEAVLLEVNCNAQRGHLINQGEQIASLCGAGFTDLTSPEGRNHFSVHQADVGMKLSAIRGLEGWVDNRILDGGIDRFDDVELFNYAAKIGSLQINL